MTEYNPFDKPFSEVNSGDIYGLEVPEGYYYEYKQSMIENEDIAKSISSFANTYGGLLFIGIEEDSETNKPEDWFTLSGDDPTKYKEKIRSITKDYIKPTPRFFTYIVKGRSKTGPEKEGYVIIVNVPESKTTPHINNNGQMYRRAGEGSDPYTQIEDPNALDDLYQRQNDWEKRVEQFCQRNTTLTQAQAGNPEENLSGTPMLEIYGVPTTLGQPVCGDVGEDLNRFSQIIQSSEMEMSSEDLETTGSGTTVNLGITVDSCRATSGGVVAQQWTKYDQDGNKDKSYSPLSIHFFTDGSIKFYIPLPTLKVPDKSQRTEAWDLIVDELDLRGGIITGKNSPDDFQFINGKETIVLLISLLNSYIKLLDEYGWSKESESLYINSRLVNTFRSMLFFEQEWYQELIKNYGPPVCYEDSIEIPRSDPFQHELHLFEDDDFSSAVFPTINIFRALGLSTGHMSNLSGTFANHLISLDN